MKNQPVVDLVDIVPGISARVDYLPCLVTGKEGLRHVLGLFWEALDDPHRRRNVRVDLLPRNYVGQDGNAARMPMGHRVFRMWDDTGGKRACYHIEVIEPHSPSRVAGRNLLSVCKRHGIDTDLAYYREYDVYDFDELKEHLAKHLRAENVADWPEGKEDITFADDVRGIERGDWVEVLVQLCKETA